MADHYLIRNWSTFQHYKDRNPTWIKVHFALLASEDWVMLDDASRLLAVVCMLVASRHEGRVPNKPAYIKRIAYLDQTPDFAPLISCGFLTEPLAPASTAQATAPERLSREETEAEKKSREERTEATASGAVAPAGQVVVPIDARTALFRDGLQTLQALTGKPERPTRTLLGRWLSAAGDDAKRVHTAISQAAENRVADPVAWIEKALKPKAHADDAIYRGVI